MADDGTPLASLDPAAVASLFSGGEAGGTALAVDPRCALHADPRGEGASSSLERPERLSRCWTALLAAGLPSRCALLPPREASAEELLAVHSRAHVDAILRASGEPCLPEAAAGEAPAASEEPEPAPGLAGPAAGDEDGRFDQDTYYNRHSARAARLAAGAVADMLLEVAEGRRANGFAVVRPPGHHAHRALPKGFCLFNSVAVAVRSAQRRASPGAALRRVAVVDWDVHHGDGTQAIFERDPSVLYVSVHRYQGGTFYPRTGAASEVGAGDAAGRTLNVPLPCKGVGDVAYERCFERAVLPALRDFAPDAVVVSAGFDCAEGDPLGEMAVSPAGFARMTAALMRPDVCRGGRLVLALEGGYNPDRVASGVVACVETLLGAEVPPPVDVRDAMSRRDLNKHNAKLARVDEMLDEVARLHAAFSPRLASGDTAPGAPLTPPALSPRGGGGGDGYDSDGSTGLVRGLSELSVQQ